MFLSEKGFSSLQIQKLLLVCFSIIFIVTVVPGCGSVPGKTGEEQVITIDELVERTLADLYKQEPATKKEIADSAGYVIMNNKITKIPVFGAGAGYGVGIETKTGKRIYLEMSRFDFGMGWGVRSVRPVLIFNNKKKFKDFIEGEWEVNLGAEAAAKAGDKGTSGGVGSSGVDKDKGYSTHLITDAGVSATFTLGVLRVSPVKLKKSKELPGR